MNPSSESGTTESFDAPREAQERSFDRAPEREPQPQRSFDLPIQPAPREEPRSEPRPEFSNDSRGADSRNNESAPPRTQEPAAPSSSNQSFHFEPTRAAPEANKTYTVWSSDGGGGARRDE